MSERHGSRQLVRDVFSGLCASLATSLLLGAAVLVMVGGLLTQLLLLLLLIG